MAFRIKRDFSQLLGKTIVNITGCEQFSEKVDFECSDGTLYRLYHEQDCCEHVNLYDTIGDANDILNSPIVLAELVTEADRSFYKLSTIKGSITLRWLAEDNPYYSTEVDFVELIGK